MADLTVIEKRKLEILLKMEDGRVLNFTHRHLHSFFKELGLLIYTEQELDRFKRGYDYFDGWADKARILRAFFSHCNNELVGNAILKLIEYIDHEIFLGKLKKNDFPPELIADAKNIAYKLLGKPLIERPKTVVSNNEVNIILQKEIFNGVQKLLNDGHYPSAVVKAYIIVIEKLRDITGKEKATDAFMKSNLENIFGVPKDQGEKDFIEGIKFLHMAIQCFRNEKVHPPLKNMEKDQALHYIALASLAYHNRKSE